MIVAQLLRYLDANVGTRLPPERRLAEEFGVSRTEVRKVLAQMEAQGRLSREVGRGTFIRSSRTTPTSRIEALQLSTSPREAMEARMLVEPALASLAAINATAENIAAMRSLAKQMRLALDWKAYEEFDVGLHRLIAEAAGNKLLVAVHETVNDVRRAVVWKWLDTRPAKPPADYSSFAEHDQIINAIEAQDRISAMNAMRLHLRTTTDQLIGSGRILDSLLIS